MIVKFKDFKMLKKYIEKYPTHISFIMDGNGKWAACSNLKRFWGHYIGANKTFFIMQYLSHVNVKYSSFYAFSIENWFRELREITKIFGLIIYFMIKYSKYFLKRLNFILIGKVSKIPILIKNIFIIINKTSIFLKKRSVLIHISYSGQQDTIKCLKDVVLNKIIYNKINTHFIRNYYISTQNIINPGILIRCGNQNRISNFMLWQIIYTEIYFLTVFWPCFTIHKLKLILKYFSFNFRTYGRI